MGFAGWIIRDAFFDRGGIAWISPNGRPQNASAAIHRDAANPQRVYVPLAYVPFTYTPADRVLADVRWMDDGSRIAWENMDQVQQKKETRFVTSMATGPQGYVWIGCEDSGVWRLDFSKRDQEAWTQFTAKGGLGEDNGYALAVGQQGRVWVGHLNHGVSVYDGQEWRNYDVTTGPLGERIFDIAVCPKGGFFGGHEQGSSLRHSSQLSPVFAYDLCVFHANRVDDEASLRH